MKFKNTSFLFFLFTLFPLLLKAQLTVDFKATTAISGCTPLIVAFRDSSVSTLAITKREWSFGNGSKDPNNNITTSNTYLIPGTYTVTLKVTTSDNQTQSKVITNYITVFAKPMAGFFEVNPKTGCTPFTVNFKDSTIKGSGDINEYTWFFGDGTTSNEKNPSKTYTEAKKYNLSLKVVDVNGCISNYVKNSYITTKAGPIADFSAQGLTGSCTPPLSVKFKNNSSGSKPLSYLWRLGNGATSTDSTPPETNYLNIGKYDVSLQITDSNGCKDTLIKKEYINIGEATTASFMASKTTACPWETISFTNNSTGATNYLWDFGDGKSSTLQNPTHSFENSGTYKVLLISSINGTCASKDSINIKIDLITAGFTSSPNSACSIPIVVNYVDKSINAVSWQWQFGNGASSISKNPSNTINEFGTFTDKLIATNSNGCSDTVSVPGNIKIEKMNPFFNTDQKKGCAPLTVIFADTSTAQNKIIAWNWDFGDGKFSNEKNPTTVFENVGKFNVTLTITDTLGCTASISDSIKTGIKQIPNFKAVPDISCAFSPVVFSDMSTDASVLDEWIWAFGDGASSLEQNPIHQYQDTGGFSITLRAGFNGCFAEITKDTNVLISGPISSFEMEGTCDDPFTFTFKPTFKNVTRFAWDFGDTTALNTMDSVVVHYFKYNVDYNVKLKTFNDTTTNHGNDSIEEPVCYYKYENIAQVRDIKSNFTVKPLACAFEQVIFDATSARDADVNIGVSHSFEWDFGDGTPISQQTTAITTHAFEKSGTYRIKLVVTDLHNCMDSSFKTIKIFHPTANYTADKLYGCTPLKVNFTNSSAGDTALVGYNWDFGDNNASTLFNPNNIYATRGRKTIKLTVTDKLGCKDSLIKTDFIYPMKPIPEFTSNTKLCKNNTAVFENTSIGDELTYKWSFGDGSSNTEQFPTHLYADSGLFTVKLFAKDSVGCDSTLTKEKYIHVQEIPVANFFTNNKIGDCFPFAVSFTDSSISPYITALSWDFGDNQEAFNNKTPVNNYTSVGEFDVSLTVSTDYGCINTVTKPKYIQVKGPIADFIVEKDNICLGDTIKFEITNSNNNIGQIIWNLDDGINKLNQKTVDVIYNSIGKKYITLVIKDLTNVCAISIIDSITVNDVSASFNSDVNSGCPNTFISFTNGSDAGDYLWHFGDLESSSNKDPRFGFSNSGIIDSIYPVKLIVTNSLGCSDTAIKNIRIFPAANAKFTSSVSEGCQIYTSIFQNEATNQNSYFWDFGNGKFSNSQKPSTSFLNLSDSVQKHQVMLATSTLKGCKDTTYKEFTVYPKPKYLIISLPDSGCSPLTVNFNAPIGAIASNWDFGDNTPVSVTGNPSHIYRNASGINEIKKVRYIGTSEWGCNDTAYSNIKVFFNPIANFTLNTSAACEPYHGIITNTTSGGAIHHWDFGDGSTLDTSGLNLTHKFSNFSDVPVTYNVKLISESILKCTDTLTKLVTVNPPIIADFSCDTIICSGQNVIFENKSIGCDQTPLSNIWNMGKGPDIQSFELSPRKLDVSGILDSTYNIRLTVTSKYNSSCKNTLTKKIFVKHNPQANFTKTENGGCGDMTIKLVNSSRGATSYHWDYGDSKSSDTLVNSHDHYFINDKDSPVNYPITLTAIAQGCSNAKTQTIKVNPKIIASFNPISNGCAPLKTTILSTSTPGSDLKWEFEGGSPALTNEINPLVEFTNTGTTDKTYQIKLTATQFGCSHDTTYSLYVYAQPKASFTATPLEQTFPDTNVIVKNTSLLISNWQYDWSFGDNNSFIGQQPLSHSYSTYGVYPIQLIISTATCSDTALQNITIKPHPPIASFNPLPAAGCPPLTVTFKSTSEYSETYLWDFGNGETSTETNPTFVYKEDGLYGITLTVSGAGGTNTITFPNVITVYEKAKAQFSHSKVVGLYINQSPVTFINESKAAKYFTWSFGDGDSSFVTNPIKYYKEKGDYDVLLIADNEHGCIDSVRNNINIYLRGLLFPNAFTPNAGGSNGGLFDIENIQNDIFFPKFEGVKNYHLMIFSRWGELIFETVDVNQGWDGYYRSKICQQDVYVWKVEVSFEDDPDKVFIYKGDITLLR